VKPSFSSMKTELDTLKAVVAQTMALARTVTAAVLRLEAGMKAVKNGGGRGSSSSSSNSSSNSSSSSSGSSRGGAGGRSKKSAADSHADKKLPPKPKRANTPYICFVSSACPKIRKEHKGITDMKEILKLAAKEWNKGDCGADNLKKAYNLADADSKRFNEEMVVYNDLRREVGLAEQKWDSEMPSVKAAMKRSKKSGGQAVVATSKKRKTPTVVVFPVIESSSPRRKKARRLSNASPPAVATLVSSFPSKKSKSKSEKKKKSKSSKKKRKKDKKKSKRKAALLI
jgi:hypothetical protein